MEPRCSPASRKSKHLGARHRRAPSFRQSAMNYRLHEDLACCQIGDTHVFLDIKKDRYFQLTGPAEKDFRDYIDQRPFDAKRLLTERILVRLHGQAPTGAFASIEKPAVSAIENGTKVKCGGSRRLAEVAILVAVTRWQLHVRPLRTNLSQLRAYRSGISNPERNAPAEEVAQLALEFQRSRLLLPIEPTCLLDTIALVKFLARRRIPANMVIGVKLNPFSAHCWAQTQGIVVNEVLGDASAYTPIMVV